MRRLCWLFGWLIECLIVMFIRLVGWSVVGTLGLIVCSCCVVCVDMVRACIVVSLCCLCRYCACVHRCFGRLVVW